MEQPQRKINKQGGTASETSCQATCETSLGKHNACFTNSSAVHLTTNKCATKNRWKKKNNSPVGTLDMQVEERLLRGGARTRRS